MLQHDSSRHTHQERSSPLHYTWFTLLNLHCNRLNRTCEPPATRLCKQSGRNIESTKEGRRWPGDQGAFGAHKSRMVFSNTWAKKPSSESRACTFGPATHRPRTGQLSASRRNLPNWVLSWVPFFWSSSRKPHSWDPEPIESDNVYKHGCAQPQRQDELHQCTATEIS